MTTPEDRFDLMIGRLDRILSQLLSQAKILHRQAAFFDIERQTLKHHAEDMIAAGNKILDLITGEKPMKLDAKFHGEIYKVKDGTIVPEDQYVVFLAKDNAFPQTLRFYRSECIRQGADEEHIAAVDRMIERLERWRGENTDLLKAPDAKGEKMLDLE